MAEEISWKEWNPGLDNDALTLGEVRATLPGVEEAEVSLLVRLLENPKSPLAFTGAITLERHDCVHILLGRGLLNQDEAFVIGFTMGTAKEEMTHVKQYVFEYLSSHLYPKAYRMSKKTLLSYELGVEAGKQLATQKIYEVPFEDFYDESLGSLRARLGINVGRLRGIYLEEQKKVSGTKASKRLPV